MQLPANFVHVGLMCNGDGDEPTLRQPEEVDTAHTVELHRQSIVCLPDNAAWPVLAHEALCIASVFRPRVDERVNMVLCPPIVDMPGPLRRALHRASLHLEDQLQVCEL
eukprot:CAMPEP_0183379030 /NCGR_PEP_ID=MMETSP0164_2-20130417/125221_1 /TAXON_ID=221442 /ORGANISM="Coccolithus pelagicus ssp braarudi, Strain PLY182g" /LENGTH=108 /DNA_ID=CAMNT_0025556607 /DNA_START=852 /DNA_END=1178 /DNA_ORIENTATION=-